MDFSLIPQQCRQPMQKQSEVGKILDRAGQDDIIKTFRREHIFQNVAVKEREMLLSGKNPRRLFELKSVDVHRKDLTIGKLRQLMGHPSVSAPQIQNGQRSPLLHQISFETLTGLIS